MRHLLLVLSLAVGCADDPSALQTITVQAPGSSLLAARAPDGAWTRFTPDPTTGDALVEVPEGAFELASVCELAGFMNYFVVRAGTGTEEVDLSCLELQADVAVTIVAPATTELHIGFFNGTGGETVNVMPGTYDVVAIDRSLVPPRFEIRRGVALEAATTLTFDVAATGTELRPVRVTTAEPVGRDEVLGVDTSLVTAGGARVFVGGDTEDQAWVFPPAALVPGDEQRVSASAAGERGSRRHRRTVTGEESELTLELPDQVTAEPRPAPELGAAWATALEPDTLYFSINDPDFAVLWDVLVEPTWTAAGGEVAPLRLPDPTELPGWEARWNLPSTSGFEWFVFVSQTTGGDSRTTDVSGTLP